MQVTSQFVHIKRHLEYKIFGTKSNQLKRKRIAFKSINVTIKSVFSVDFWYVELYYTLLMISNWNFDMIEGLSWRWSPMSSSLQVLEPRQAKRRGSRTSEASSTKMANGRVALKITKSKKINFKLKDIVLHSQVVERLAMKIIWNSIGWLLMQMTTNRKAMSSNPYRSHTLLFRM